MNKRFLGSRSFMVAMVEGCEIHLVFLSGLSSSFLDLG